MTVPSNLTFPGKRLGLWRNCNSTSPGHHVHSGQEVAMMVKTKQNYSNKVQNLLAQGYAYREIMADPINKHKNKLTNLLRTIKVQKWLVDITYKRLYQTGVGPPIVWVTLNKKGHPLDPQYPVAVLFHIKSPMSWLTSSGHWWVISLIALGTLNILWTSSSASDREKRNAIYHILWRLLSHLFQWTLQPP